MFYAIMKSKDGYLQMDRSLTTQNQLFCFQALPDLFHSTADQLIALLQRDGNKFLQFYWDEAGKRLRQDTKVIPFGLNYEFIELPKSRLIIHIKLPVPILQGDARYLALLYRPDRVMLFGFLPDITKVLILVQTADEGIGHLVEITRKLEPVRIRSNIPISKVKFLEVVKEEMD
jgi:YD repeat-containing protein